MFAAYEQRSGADKASAASGNAVGAATADGVTIPKKVS